MNSIFEEIIHAGIEYDNHCSDLYVKDSPEAREIIKRYDRSLEFFNNAIDGSRWIDVPFAYDPYWDKRG